MLLIKFEKILIKNLFQFKDRAVSYNKMSVTQKNSYLGVQAAVQQQMQQATVKFKQNSVHKININQSNQVVNSQETHVVHTQNSSLNQYSIKVPQISGSSSGGADSTFTVPDDVGMGYEGGVRVLQTLSSWSPDVTYNVPRPNLIPFTEPYVEGGSMHPASRLKALQQVQQASLSIRKSNNSKSEYKLFASVLEFQHSFSVFLKINLI